MRMKPDAVTRKAYAKINLTLDVTGRREDGYHLLSSVMQTIGIYDTITVTRENSGEGRGTDAAPAGDDFFVEGVAIDMHTPALEALARRLAELGAADLSFGTDVSTGEQVFYRAAGRDHRLDDTYSGFVFEDDDGLFVAGKAGFCLDPVHWEIRYDIPFLETVTQDRIITREDDTITQYPAYSVEDLIREGKEALEMLRK